MKISRQVGTASQIIQVFAQDFSVTTGAGIANIPATTVSYTWFRNNQVGASTGVGVSTASMGTYTSGAWTQVNSATALGWYQFGIPNGALVSGDCSALHLYVSTGAFNIAPIPIEIELTKTNNQQYMSSQTIGFVQNGVNVTSMSSAVTTTANVVQILGTAAAGAAGYVGVDWANVTNKAAYNNLSSTFISTNQSIAGASAPTAAQVAVAVWDEITTSHTVSSTFGLALRNMSALSSTWVTTSDIASSSQIIQGVWNELTTAYTSAASTMGLAVYTAQSASGLTSTVVGDAVWSRVNSSYTGVSTFGYLARAITSVSAGVNVTAFSGTITTNANLMQIYGSAAVTSASGQLRVSTQAIDKGGYGVTTIAATITTNANIVQVHGSAVVTSASGTLTVSTQAIPTFAVAGDAMALTAGERAAVAGVILTTTQAEGYRSVNAPGSLIQMQYEILANLTEQTASGTTRTLASVTSHTGNVAQYQYDSSSNPASITRIA